jgi:CubicO group peptidase (beta-lactamase class C family)
MAELIQGMRTSYPVTATNQRPAYSNVAFTVVFIALENVTGKNYTVLLDELLSQPLDLKATHPSPGNDDNAVIPPGENGWGSDYGENAP